MTSTQRIDALEQKAAIGKRNRRQALAEVKRFAFKPERIKSGHEAAASQLEAAIRSTIELARKRGYTRQRATQIATWIHRDSIASVVTER